jgi:hypothetical protein
LDDQAAPADRRAKALYNRGVCILKRATDVKSLRIAVACFEQVLDSHALPDELRLDARFNLELAKLLWAEARIREGTREPPNELPPDDSLDFPRPVLGEEPGQDPGPGTESPGPTPAGSPKVVQDIPPHTTTAQPTDRKAPGSGTLPVLMDDPQPQKLSPEDARAHLARVAERLNKDRRANARLLAGPERPHVRDW